MPKFISEIKHSGNSNFALLDSLNLRGGFMQVSTLEERDSIIPDKLRKGMLVYVEENETIYDYRGDEFTVFSPPLVEDLLILNSHSEVTEVTTEEDYYKITFKDNIFEGNDIIGFNIDSNLNGTYAKVEYVKDNYAYISRDAVHPNKYDTVYLVGSTEDRLRQKVLMLHKYNGVMVLTQFVNVSLDNINTNYTFRLGQSSTNTWSAFGENVYFKGTFIDNQGRDLASLVTVNAATINTGLASVRLEFGYENLLNNPYFIDSMDCWLTKNSAKYFKAKGNFVMTNKTLLTTKKTGAYVTVEDGQILLKLVNGYITLKNENLRKITTDLDELPKPYYVTLIFSYKAITDGNLKVSIDNESDEGYDSKPIYKVELALEADENYHTFKSSFLWNGTGDFTLDYSGEIKLQSMVIKVNEVKSFEKKYQELFEYSDVLIEIAKKYKELIL